MRSTVVPNVIKFCIYVILYARKIKCRAIKKNKEIFLGEGEGAYVTKQ